jgi:AraC family transcriptional regulator of arabinose operon
MHSGEGWLTINKTVHPLKAGTAYLLLPRGHEYFRFSADKETHHSWCAVYPEAMPRNLQKALRQSRFSVPCSVLLNSLFDAALNLEPAQADSSPPVLIEHLAFCIFAEFLHISSKEDCERLGVSAVQSFMHYINAHFGDEECLTAARKAAGISRNTLLFKFRQTLQTTPARYLWKLRVERGVAMLTETGQTVAEIAYRCGFKSPFHFSRLCKQHMGGSPKQIRRQAWSEDPDPRQASPRT